MKNNTHGFTHNNFVFVSTGICNSVRSMRDGVVYNIDWEGLIGMYSQNATWRKQSIQKNWQHLSVFKFNFKNMEALFEKLCKYEEYS